MNHPSTFEIVNSLFERMMAIHPAFRQSWPTEEEFKATKKEWVLAFEESGLNSIERLKKGLSKMRQNSSPFIPSPGQFIQWCNFSPEDIGSPSIEAAFAEACLQARPQTWTSAWSHQAVKHAYNRTGNHQFLVGSSSETKSKFIQHYLQVCQDYAAGRIVDQLEHKKPFAKTDEGKPETIGKYEFSRPGVLKIFENIRGRQEAMEVMKNMKGLKVITTKRPANCDLNPTNLPNS